jgi:hypothetical protein
MRTSLSLDDDLVRLLDEESRRSGTSFEDMGNYFLRLGLTAAKNEVRDLLAPASGKIGLVGDKSYDDIEALLDDLEDPAC